MLGAWIVPWFWGTHWQVWSNQPTYAQAIASLSNKITASEIVTFWLDVFFGVHIVFAFYSFLLPFQQRWKLGVRRPSQREQEHFEGIYQSLARGGGRLVRPRRWKVADGLGMQAHWIGYVLVVDRELLHHRFFAPVLAHHLGHVSGEDRIAHRLYAMFPPLPGFAGIIAGLPFSFGLLLLYPLWMWYWREMIFAADRVSVGLGQGHALVTGLTEIYQKVDPSTRGGRVLKTTPC